MLRPDCCACGACCIAPFDQDTFCEVDEKDLQRLGRRLVRKHVRSERLIDQLVCGAPEGAITAVWRKQRAGPLKGYDLCVCVFLRGSVFHRTSCGIYSKRPAVCRKAFKPGDQACRATRRGFEESELYAGDQKVRVT